MKKIICILLAASLLVLSGCGSSNSGTSDGDGTLTPVTLNEVAHSIFYAPQYEAIENGYFEEEGIDLTLVTALVPTKWQLP